MRLVMHITAYWKLFKRGTLRGGVVHKMYSKPQYCLQFAVCSLAVLPVVGIVWRGCLFLSTSF
jgi:hypothetical protein